ncbi:MAG: heparinase II/III family protein [Pseudomonadota bacterium]
MSLLFAALRAQLARPIRKWRNRTLARRASLSGKLHIAEVLPEPMLFGAAERGQALVSGSWQALGYDLDLQERSIWTLALPDKRLDAMRHGFTWLEDLAALGNKSARELAQQWLLEWAHRYGRGRGPGWTPDRAGLRLQQWTAHSALLSRGLSEPEIERFWRAFAAQQRYLEKCWRQADPGLAQMNALAGLVWSGVVLPDAGHRIAMAELGKLAEAYVDAEGEVSSRRPDDLGNALILLIWTARILENAGQSAPPAHLSAIIRGVPVLRPLRMGDGSFARFHGGSGGDSDQLDKALAELRIGAQQKPPLSMGFCRLTGGRNALVLDAAEPPKGPLAQSAHASTLAFEWSVGRQPVIVNCGSGEAFGAEHSLKSRHTRCHSTVEIGGRSSSQIRSGGLTASTFGPQLEDGPSLVSLRQAQDATGQWLLATHDGYSKSVGVIHERRVFVEARGTELRGEDIISVPDARARTVFERASRSRPVTCCACFHVHPDITAEMDTVRQLILLLLPNESVWVFRASGGDLGLEPSVYYEANSQKPRNTKQIRVDGKIQENIAQLIWSFRRLRDAPKQSVSGSEPADIPSASED